MIGLRYGSVCSGIEAATVAWHPLGWRPAFFSEIEAFPRAVLAHHYPDVPLHGDFTTIGADEYGPIDLLVGGTPCQSFSIAGLRGGLADDRGNLALEYIRLARRKRTRWLVWENVPGVFSSNEGQDFRCFLSGLVGWSVPIPEGGWQNAGIITPGPGNGAYGVAWRVLDAQFAGVPQRRRRVFVVGYLGDWRRAAAVLFERHSLQGHPAPRREAGQIAPTVPSRSTAGGGLGTDFDCDGGLITFDRQSNGEYGTEPVASTIHARDYKSATDLIAHSLRGEGFDASEDGTGRGTPLVPVAIQERAVSENPSAGPDGAGFRTDGMAYTLEARTVPQAVAFSIMPMNSGKDYKARETDVAQPIMAGGPVGGNQGGDFIRQASAVRRLTPTECARLQGFPDDYLDITYRGKPAADGPKYKALGNSMAVPCMRWIGERIQQVEALSQMSEAA